MSSSLSKPPLERPEQGMFRLGTTGAQPGGHPLRVAQPDGSGAYAFRPTAPNGIMIKLPPSLGQIEIVEPPAVTTDHIELALSMRPMPVWKEDSAAPPTLRAISEALVLASLSFIASTVTSTISVAVSLTFATNAMKGLRQVKSARFGRGTRLSVRFHVS